MAGVTALVIGILPNIPGFMHAAGFVESVPAIFDTLYAYAWFVGLIIASMVYLLSNRVPVTMQAKSASP